MSLTQVAVVLAGAYVIVRSQTVPPAALTLLLGILVVVLVLIDVLAVHRRVP